MSDRRPDVDITPDGAATLIRVGGPVPGAYVYKVWQELLQTHREVEGWVLTYSHSGDRWTVSFEPVTGPYERVPAGPVKGKGWGRPAPF